MDIPNEAMILVADGEKALFLRNKGDAEFPNFVVEGKEVLDNPPSGEQGSDRPGRAMGDPSNRSAMEETDWHQLEKDRFVAEIANMLLQQATKKKFDRLVVAAPPHTLGELRKHLHKSVSDRIIGEVDKDLTHLPVYEIEAHLKKET